MRKITGGTIGLFDLGFGMLLMGYMGLHSSASQIAWLAGLGSVPIFRDLMIFGLIVLGCAAFNHLGKPQWSDEPFEVRGPSKPLIVNIGACLLIALYFLPWVHVLDFSGSGYQLSKLGIEGSWSLLMPILAAIVLLNAALGRPLAWVALIAGAMPILILFYGLAKVGRGLFGVLDFGGILAILTGIAMIACAQNFYEFKMAGK